MEYAYLTIAVSAREGGPTAYYNCNSNETNKARLIKRVVDAFKSRCPNKPLAIINYLPLTAAEYDEMVEEIVPSTQRIDAGEEI